MNVFNTNMHKNTKLSSGTISKKVKLLRKLSKKIQRIWWNHIWLPKNIEKKQKYTKNTKERCAFVQVDFVSTPKEEEIMNETWIKNERQIVGGFPIRTDRSRLFEAVISEEIDLRFQGQSWRTSLFCAFSQIKWSGYARLIFLEAWTSSKSSQRGFFKSLNARAKAQGLLWGPRGREGISWKQLFWKEILFETESHRNFWIPKRRFRKNSSGRQMTLQSIVLVCWRDCKS